MTFVSWAQNFEDVMLWRALRHVEHGFWIDVGAADPESLSVTRAFSERGWRGINIEPADRPFRLLQAARPLDINLQLAAGEAEGNIRLFVVGDANGLTTTDATVAATHAASGYSVATEMVAMKTLADICDSHLTGPIHFLKIDVEGAEKEVLAGADFARFRPWIVLVESTAPLSSIETHENWERYLVDADYRFAYFDGLNRFYLAGERSAELLPHFCCPPNALDNFVRVGEVAALTRAEAAEARANAAEAEVARNHAPVAAAEAQLTRIAARATAAQAAHARAAARAAAAEVQAANFQARAIAAEGQVTALSNSTSWRVTRPLRSLIYRARSLSRHPGLRWLRAIVRREPGALVAPSSRLPDAGLGWPESFRLLEDDVVMALRASVALSRI